MSAFTVEQCKKKKIIISLYTLTALLLNALRHQPLNFYLLPLKRLLFIYEQLHISHSIRINIESCPSSKFAGRKLCALSSVNGSLFVQRNICENCFFVSTSYTKKCRHISTANFPNFGLIKTFCSILFYSKTCRLRPLKTTAKLLN